MNCGDKKFFKNQNLTGLLVCFMSDNIIIRKRRSYKCPDATEKMLIVSGSVASVPPLEKELVIEFQMPELPSSSSANKSARSLPFFLLTRSFTT